MQKGHSMSCLEMSARRNEANVQLLLFFFVFAVIRLGLYLSAPYFYIPGSGYDDLYLLDMARSIRNTGWLGNYTYVTLIKGISFPLFMAISNALSIPYSCSLGVYHIIAVLVFCFALKKILNNRVIIAFSYLWLLYSPVTFGYIAIRVYRNAIVFPAVIHVLGCMLMVYYNRNEKMRKLVPWLSWLGLSFSFFYYVREDSLWLLPMLIACLLICIIQTVLNSSGKKKKALLKASAFIIPIAIFLLTNTAYKWVNEKNYNVFTTNDRSGSAFATLTGNMIRVEDSENLDKDIWISRSKFEHIVDACPTLAANKDTFMYYYDHWDNGSDIRGDLSVWAFREALNALGYYVSADTTESFCNSVNRELLESVQDHRLTFDNAIHFTTQSRGFYMGEIMGLLRNTLKTMYDMIIFENTNIGLFPTGEKGDEIVGMETFTGLRTITTMDMYTRVSGWLVLKDNSVGEIWLRILDGNRQVLIDKQGLYPRGDIEAAFPAYSHSLMSGFSMELGKETDANTCILQVYSGEDTLVKEVKLTDIFEDDDIIVYNDINAKRYYDPVVPYYESYVNNALHIYELASKISKVLTVISLIAWLFLTGLFVIKRKSFYFDQATILTGFFLSAFILEYGISLFNTWLHNEWFYSSGFVAIGQAFQLLSLVYLVLTIRDMLDRRHRNRSNTLAA